MREGLALVTGAAGLVGSAIVRARLRRGLPTRGLVRSGRPTTSLDGLAVELCEGDVLAPETLAAAMTGVDVLFHTATYFAYGQPADGALEAVKFPREGAGLLSSLADTDGLVELGEDVTQVLPGQTVGFLSYASLIN